MRDCIGNIGSLIAGFDIWHQPVIKRSKGKSQPVVISVLGSRAMLLVANRPATAVNEHDKRDVRFASNGEVIEFLFSVAAVV